MAVYPMLFHCRMAGIHSGWSAGGEGQIIVDLFLQRGAEVDLPTAVRYMLILVANNSMNELDS